MINKNVNKFIEQQNKLIEKLEQENRNLKYKIEEMNETEYKYKKLKLEEFEDKEHNENYYERRIANLEGEIRGLERELKYKTEILDKYIFPKGDKNEQ